MKSFCYSNFYKFLSILLYSFVAYHSAVAQTSKNNNTPKFSTNTSKEVIITGKVLDSNTKQPIAFSSIGIEGQAVGTSSNENGEFELHLPTTLITDTIMVSCIGYAHAKIPVKSISNKNDAQFELEPRNYNLADITIHSTRLSAHQIVQKAMHNISINYITKPANFNGFYREYFKENGEYVAFSEASVSIYDEDGYEHTEKKNKDKEAIQINEIRVSDINNKGDYVLYIDLNYALRANLVRNASFWENFIQKNKLKLNKLELNKISYFGEDLVYCIDYELENKNSGLYSGRLYIRTKDFVVLKIELNTLNYLRHRSLNGSPHNSNAVLTFKPYKGKFYLNYMYASHSVTYQEKNERFSLVFTSELIINDLNVINPTPILADNRMKDASIFYQPRYRTYDPTFWETYNLFENSDANDSIIEDLEKNRSLELQYRANGKLKVKPTQKPAYTPLGNTDKLPQNNHKNSSSGNSILQKNESSSATKPNYKATNTNKLVKVADTPNTRPQIATETIGTTVNPMIRFQKIGQPTATTPAPSTQQQQYPMFRLNQRKVPNTFYTDEN